MGLSDAAFAIDAGNSKTDVALVAADGTVLGEARGGGFQPHRDGTGRAVAGLAPLLATASERAGLTGRVRVGHVQACLANADLPVEEQRLTEALAARGWAETVTVANDTFALLRAGLPDEGEPTGVAVVCGAGINCAGLAPDGRIARFPAIGRLSGDWGGGGHLADEALWWAARADDGRGEPSELARALPDRFGLPDMPALIEALHLGAVDAARRHELTPVLFAVAEAGDAVARAIVARQAEEVVAMAVVALRRLDLLDAPVPVVLGGGVLAARHRLLHERVLALLADRAPKASPVVVTAPPVLGAALLTLDRGVAAAASLPGAYARLRAHYA
ncbi:BadF/BadG/BcrA/BcrD ATPase family protein [Streptomyces sp. UNOC14_S4]|uniref:N-acetylglucosamine kinase n=1 Tax=Streptomyces sp. UNOC14_S4 TaxID=2872340 RepID=UPI001E4DB98D|nr:BadF/BadG/BcrA/BcrD ATPase family protein [Streptomyces sp. UNOC14_S4]MCC3768331.1 ATPase [Streptomyces sp. UNOC14_S4]